MTYAVVATKGSNNSSFSTNDNYAYITDSAYQSSTGYITYKVWTGEKEETVTEKKSSTTNRSEGTVIGYSSIKDGEIEDVVNQVIGTGTTDFKAGAVQGINDKQTKVSFDGATQHDITSDTVILYVDTDKNEGQAGGSIAEADKFGDTYFNNVYYKLDSSGDVELLVVDVKNMLNGEITMADPSADDLNTALQSGDVTVKTLPATGTVTVPAGKTLTVTTKVTSNDVFTKVNASVGAKLVLKAGADSADYNAVYQTTGKSTGENTSTAGTTYGTTTFIAGKTFIGTTVYTNTTGTTAVKWFG